MTASAQTRPTSLIALGYMRKKIALCPDWIKAANVRDIYAVSDCISENFADYIPVWKHNGFWFFNSPSDIADAAHELNASLEDTTLLYLEGYTLEYDDETKRWQPYEAVKDFPAPALITPPHNKILMGYDVVTYSIATSAECSPLSCNRLAQAIKVNEHCLLGSLDEAMELLETGRFSNAEPGPFRIIAVYTVPTEQVT